MSRLVFAMVANGGKAATASSRLALLVPSRGLASGGGDHHQHHHSAVEHTTKENFLEKDMNYADMHQGKQFGEYGLPDALGYAVGRSRLEKLAAMAGNDHFYEHRKVFKFYPNSKERPHLVPSHLNYRQVGCPCNETHCCYTYLHKNVNQRCYCGHHMRLVSYDEYFQDLRKRVAACYEAYHKLPEGKRSFDQLSEEFQALAHNFPAAAKLIAEGKLNDALPPNSWKELEESYGQLRMPLFPHH